VYEPYASKLRKGQFVPHPMHWQTLIAVCSIANLALLRSPGVYTLLDYTNDQTSALRRYDVVFDAVGRRKTSPMKVALRNTLTSMGKFISMDDRLPRFRRDDLIRLRELAEAGKLKPVIDRRYLLECIAEAHLPRTALSEFLPELSRLFLDRFSVQRNSLRFALFAMLNYAICYDRLVHNSSDMVLVRTRHVT
jgi:hypothetical protein